jgi:hypothetical protein
LGSCATQAALFELWEDEVPAGTHERKKEDNETDMGTTASTVIIVIIKFTCFLL